MTPRFSPYAIIKTLSFNTLLQAGQSPADLGLALLNILNSSNNIWGALEGNFDLFKPIGIANNVSIDESYNSRPIWGIGEPTNPIVVPNNYSATISISRMTLDTLSVRDFTTLPDYWYVPTLQRRVEEILGPVTGRDFVDYPFYTFISITSVEKPDVGFSDIIQPFLNRSLYVFMPSEYSTRISGDDTIIMTDVRGTGKLVNLRGLIETLANALLGG